MLPTPEHYGPLFPISFYAASKIACETLITAFTASYQMKCWIFRFGNIVGGYPTHGVIHDFVISIAVRAGFGRPTLYFVIQGLGLFAERSKIGRRLGLGRGARGWLFCLAVTALPVGLLFHRPFLERVVIPMLTAFRGT